VTDIVKHDLPATLVDPATGEAVDLGPAALLSVFDVGVLEAAIFEWPPERVAFLLRSFMDWEQEVGRHLKRVMSDALYANLVDKAAKLTVEAGGVVVKGEKQSVADDAEVWSDEAVYDACVELVEAGELLPEVLDEFKIEQRSVVTCTATTVRNLRAKKGPVADAINALVRPAPRPRKAVTVSWK
jgi:hypothetical protein